MHIEIMERRKRSMLKEQGRTEGAVTRAFNRSVITNYQRGIHHSVALYCHARLKGQK